jgi:hypothetical protein
MTGWYGKFARPWLERLKILCQDMIGDLHWNWEKPRNSRVVDYKREKLLFTANF